MRNDELMRHVFEQRAHAGHQPRRHRGALHRLAARARGASAACCRSTGADVVLGAAARLDGPLRAAAARGRSRRCPTATTWRRCSGWTTTPRNRDVPAEHQRDRRRSAAATSPIDLTGSHDEVETAVNSPLEGSTKIAAYFIVRSIFLDQFDARRLHPEQRGDVPPGPRRGARGLRCSTRASRAPPTRASAPARSPPTACCSRWPRPLPEQVSAGTGAEVHVIAFSGLDEATRATTGSTSRSTSPAGAAGSARTAWTRSAA